MKKMATKLKEETNLRSILKKNNIEVIKTSNLQIKVSRRDAQ